MTSAARKRQIVFAATRLLSQQGVDLTRQVDVFALIRASSLVLRFMDLEQLLGAFVAGDPAGVLINSRLPAPLQRYTGAHELGHWTLHKDEFALDTSLEIEGRTPARLEQEAQLFASYLLMPQPLITRAARDAEVRQGSNPTADQIYSIAGTMGVSFAAALIHLENVGLISAPSARALRKVRPVNVQRSRTFGEKLADPRTHVWSASEVGEARDQDLYRGDIVAVDLPENRTTGYRWFIDVAADGSAGELLDDDAEVDEPVETFVVDRFKASDSRTEAAEGAHDAMPVGSGGRRQVLIRANAEGHWRATLAYAPVQRPDDPVERKVIGGTMHLPPGPEQRRALIEAYKAAESGTGE